MNVGISQRKFWEQELQSACRENLNYATARIVNPYTQESKSPPHIRSFDTTGAKLYINFSSVDCEPKKIWTTSLCV